MLGDNDSKRLPWLSSLTGIRHQAVFSIAVDNGLIGSGAPRLARKKGVPEDHQAARLGGAWTPRELSDLVGPSRTSVTETVYRHEIRPALTKEATARTGFSSPRSRNPRSRSRRETNNSVGSPVGSRNLSQKPI